jgi:hypothetical protein
MSGQPTTAFRHEGLERAALFQSHRGTSLAKHDCMTKPFNSDNEPEPAGPEGVPVDAPDNSAPAISPHAVSRMPRAEDDRTTWEHSPEFSDEKNVSIDDRVAGEAWIPGVSDPAAHRSE